jgi:hypothetical protein
VDFGDKFGELNMAEEFFRENYSGTVPVGDN